MRLPQKIVQRSLAIAAWGLVVAIVAVAVAAYVAVSGRDLRLLKTATTGLGTLLDGQRTDAISIEATVLPDEQRLEAHARLKLTARREPRRLFYFLLNDGLKVRSVRAVGSAARPTVFQFWLVTVVQLPEPLAADDTLELEFAYDGRPTAGGLGLGGGLLDARDVLLTVDDLWYPNDAQSFFEADVSVTLPTRMTLVHNGREVEHAERGERQRVRWQSERPLAGMSLVAGSYHRTATRIDDQPVQLFLADDVTLNAEQVVRDMAATNDLLTQRFGASGFPQLTGFVTRRLRRAFNDGAGTLGLSIRHFRRGDYGFATLAHEIAHNWWGATVAEHWLSPGTGGEWIVEGLAEYSSLLAIEDRWGRDALTRSLLSEGFDPARQGTLGALSILDNGLADASARDTIYHKGAYAALMLRNTIGDDALQQSLRQFLQRFHQMQVTERDLETVVTQVSGQNVAQFFADWVRSNKSADLVLEPSGADQVEVRNRGEAIVPGSIDLWISPGSGAAPEQRKVKVGETVALPTGVEAVVLDPQLAWADMLRFNNRSPRSSAPQFVTVSSRGDVLMTTGEPQPWAPMTLEHRTADGKPIHSWEFERGMTQPPVWSADGARVLVSASEATGEWPAIYSLNAVDGVRTLVGYGATPAFGSNGRIFATRGDQLLRFESNSSRVIMRHRGKSLEAPIPAPSGRSLVYAAASGSAVELRMCDENGADDRPLLTWDRDRVLVRWAPDESRVYALMGGDWDWQVWEIPLDNSGVRVLVREAADIRDLALSSDGNQLAFIAAATLTHPPLRHELFVLDLKGGRARVIAAPGGEQNRDVRTFAWETPDSVLAIIGSNETPLVIPEHRDLRRIRLNDGSWEAVSRGQ